MYETHVRQVIAAGPEVVWATLTEPDQLATWFWPWNPEIQFSPIVGTAYSIAASHPAAGRLAVDGSILAADPPRRLFLTWHWSDGQEAETQVELRLDPSADGTEIVVRHTEIADEATADDYRRAWTDLLERLASTAERRAATPDLRPAR